jgi:hypothetical protein
VSSSKPEILAALALTAAATIVAVPAALKGFAIKVECVDPNGVKSSVEGAEAQYSFFRRTILRKPEGPEGKRFRDEETRLDAFSFQGHRIPFQKIREVRFDWREEDSRETLVIDFEMTTGERLERKGADLDGADHPLSPAVVFQTADGPVRIPMDPLTPAALRKGHPAISRIEFPNNPDRRYAPRR